VDLLNILFPKRCVGCRKIGRYFCKNCIRTIRIIQNNEYICPVCEKPAIDGITHPGCRGKYATDGLTSFFRYDGTVRNAVREVKYRLVSDLADEFTGLIPLTSYNMLRQRIGNRRTILVPIPLHRFRRRFRGFNQAEILGLRIAKKLNLPLGADILIRVKATAPQVEMKKRTDRLANMEHVFAVNPKWQNPEHYDGAILFDDVFTTGATMRSAANSLKRSGIPFVWAVTMAR
jgi:ComF family protein